MVFWGSTEEESSLGWSHAAPSEGMRWCVYDCLYTSVCMEYGAAVDDGGCTGDGIASKGTRSSGAEATPKVIQVATQSTLRGVCAPNLQKRMHRAVEAVHLVAGRIRGDQIVELNWL